LPDTAGRLIIHTPGLKSLLADAVIKAVCSDKRKTRKEIAEKVMENPEIFLEFVDNFMTEAK
ncbi:MAG: hypothetical protein K1V78_00730, partial [Muribaculaceae bacterium]